MPKFNPFPTSPDILELNMFVDFKPYLELTEHCGSWQVPNAIAIAYNQGYVDGLEEGRQQEWVGG